MDTPDLTSMKTLTLQGVFVSALLSFLVMRYVAKTAVRFVLLGVCVALGAGLWFYRDSLDTCAKTCSCTAFGKEVRVPGCAGAESDRKPII